MDKQFSASVILVSLLQRKKWNPQGISYLRNKIYFLENNTFLFFNFFPLNSDGHSLGKSLSSKKIMKRSFSPLVLSYVDDTGDYHLRCDELGCGQLSVSSSELLLCAHSCLRKPCVAVAGVSLWLLGAGSTVMILFLLHLYTVF